MQSISTKSFSSGFVRHRLPLLAGVAAFSLLVGGCDSMGMSHDMGMKPAGTVSLSGMSEVPPNASTATGSGVIKVASDHTVSGSITTKGIDGTVAHIHLAAKGTNGPVIVPLTKTADGVWSVPAGAKLSDSQYASYVSGDTYVNVHSAALPAGEIRGQLSAN